MMRRQDNQAARPMGGGVSVPLFNQKKRNRVPLTSSPSVNEFFSHSEYKENIGSAAPHSSTTGTYGGYKAPGPPSGPSQSDQWKRRSGPQAPQPQKFDSNRPAPGPAPTKRTYAPMAHPYKPGSTSSNTGQPTYPGRQPDPISCAVKSQQNKYQPPYSSETTKSKPLSLTGFSHVGQQSSYRPLSQKHQQPQQLRLLPPPVPPVSKAPPRATPPPNNTWKSTSSFGPQSSSSFVDKRSSKPPQTGRPTQTQQAVYPKKPTSENSLRILTAVIDGIRHWSQFKDKVPYLFEIYATLDSAVTRSHHTGKAFLMTDGKDVVQCVFFETEQELPRLIRGQVLRCVGSYDCTRDVLMCVSIRPGLPSEQRNAHEIVKVCDAEMRAVVKSLSEV